MTHKNASREQGDDFGDRILSKSVKAGRRTYFFDVRATRGDDYFITITESRKLPSSGGQPTFDRHKIFLYKEDFSKFAAALQEVTAFVRDSKPDYFSRAEEKPGAEAAAVSAPAGELAGQRR